MRIRSENGKDYVYTKNDNCESHDQRLHEANKEEEEKRNFKCDIFDFIQETPDVMFMTPLKIYEAAKQKKE